MTDRWLVAIALSMVLGVSGCGGGEGDMDGSPPDEDGGPITGMDAGPPVDAGPGIDAGPRPDGGPPSGDAGPGEDGGPPPWDSGPPQPCDTPGTLESVSCGRCGTVERFCSSAREWAYGECMGQGGCEPGSVGDIMCGNCGTQAARCSDTCAWEATAACTGEGVCAPGTRSRSGAGCGAGETREVLCDDACAQQPVGACEADGCTSPGTLETVSCGDCGTQNRFCTASRAWEYGACMGEGECTPGSTEPVACGMCGTQTRRCLSSCAWELTGSCTGEGTCTPGAVTNSSVGCPAGQTKQLTCSASCAFVETMGCTMRTSLDVTVLLDMTGSAATRVGTNLGTLSSRLVAPLLALGDVAVGVSYYADFMDFTSPTDRPFDGGIEPTRMMSSIDAELAARPTYSGGDTPESGVEALFILAGGAPHSSALPLTCSAGRAAGGCWRSGARRVIIIYTDAPNHNGPDPAGAGIYEPYPGTTGAASWSATQTRLLADGTHVIFLYHVTSGTENTAGYAQAAEMLTDLSQPATNRIDATSFGPACDAAVARVRTIGGF